MNSVHGKDTQLTVMTDFLNSKADTIFLPALSALSPLKAGLVTAFLGVHQLVTSKKRNGRCDPTQ